jgi:hypothetical protein
MQMSSTTLYVFVEGKQCDPYFYSQVCNSTLNPNITFDILTAGQLPGSSGGKQKLLDFFNYLRTNRSLVSSLGGHRTACIFFLDKDVDDLLRIKKRSPHLVYTRYYDIQNYVFENGDLTKGSAAAASVDPRRLEGHLGDSSRWCRQIATLWKDWLALCLRLLEDKISGEANYKVLSQVQTRLCGTTDHTALDKLMHDIARRAGIPITDLRSRLRMSRNKVNSYLQREDHHRIFKGKWFSAVLADDIDRLMADDPYDDNALGRRLPCTIAATLDFSLPWADDFKRPLLNIAALL